MEENKIKCIVVDDEPLALALLTDYINRTEGLLMLEKFTDPIKAIHYIENTMVHLIFLDIQMPELNGIQFMKILNNKCGVILTTAYNEYALDGYEFSVIDYLLKPISYERFIKATEKAKKQISGNGEKKLPDQNDFIFIRSEYKLQKVELKDIFYLEGVRDYVALHTEKGKILTLQSMKSFEEILPANKFIRIHKSFLISIQQIKAIEKKRVLVDQTYLPIGEVYMEKFLAELGLN